MIIFQQLRSNKPTSILLTLIFILLTDSIVFFAGGTETVFTHMMYIPVIFTAFIFGARGSLIAALISGLTLGPMMPMNVSEGIMQEPVSWILRILFFAVMGLVVSTLLWQIKKDHEVLMKKSYEHYITGFPNLNKLKHDLDEIIMKQNHFTLVAFKITNLSYINNYVDNIVEEKALLKVIDILSESFNKEDIYSAYTNQFVVLLRNKDIKTAYFRAEKFLEKFHDPIQIDGFPVELLLKSAVVNYPIHSEQTDDLIKKLARALDQETDDGIAVYERSLAKKNKENYEIVVALHEAIKNNEFSIVYQPKIELETVEMIGAEALIRWTSRTKGKINPEEFIRLAEYTGMINEITKWMIENTIHQMKKWKEEGLSIKVAVNISAKDLKDDTIIEYTKKYLRLNQVDPRFLEFELTERTIVENQNEAEQLLNEISSLGIKTALDDFGTGYNSLIHLVYLPIDHVKLDKFFIQNLNDVQNRPLVEGVINTIHTLGKKIIAEGVETAEQLKLLSDMGCDYIQGYYYSKPLPPENIKSFLKLLQSDRILF